jgi:hypothetical protein
MKRIGRLAVIIAINLAIILVGLEIGLRLVPAAIPETILKRYDAVLRTEIAQRRNLPNVSDTVEVKRDDGGPPLLIFKPHVQIEFKSRETGKRGVIRMDERGFCNPPGAVPQGTTVDFVALGDSFTACMNEPPDSEAPESYINWPFETARLAGLSVYNISRGGDGPYEYVQLLKHYGLQFRPRAVIMQLYEGNDLRDAVRYRTYKEAPPDEKERLPLRASWEPLHIPYEGLMGNALSERSYAYGFAVIGTAYALSHAIEFFQWLTDNPNYIDFRFTLGYPPEPVVMNADNDQKDEVRTARSAQAGEISFSEFDAALENYAELARANNFKPFLSYAPAAHVSYREAVSFAKPELKETMLRYSETQRSYIAGKCAELGIVFIDLTPALQAKIAELNGTKLLYNPDNIHFNVLGHHVVSEAVRAVLIREGLLASR